MGGSSYAKPYLDIDAHTLRVFIIEEGFHLVYIGSVWEAKSMSVKDLRRNVLATSLRCWFRPFSPNSPI